VQNLCIKIIFRQLTENCGLIIFCNAVSSGIINVGGKGSVTADDAGFALNKLDCLYIGKGTQKVFFESEDAAQPAVFIYCLHLPMLCIPSVRTQRRCGECNAWFFANEQRKNYIPLHS
jgi:5-keto 4-deoxyuronate isomerase